MEPRSIGPTRAWVASPAPRDVLSFGGGFFDYDNDGWLDIFVANGHVYPEVEQATPGRETESRTNLLGNEERDHAREHHPEQRIAELGADH